MRGLLLQIRSCRESVPSTGMRGKRGPGQKPNDLFEPSYRDGFIPMRGDNPEERREAGVRR